MWCRRGARVGLVSVVVASASCAALLGLGGCHPDTDGGGNGGSLSSASIGAGGTLCADLASDAENCGVCGHSCQGGACQKGQCQPVVLASGQTPREIAVDATSVYWTSYADGAVMKVAIGGGAPTLLASGQKDPFAIAVDAASVYWTNLGDGTVMKVAIGGGDPTVLASGQISATGIAVKAGRVYWTNIAAVMSVAVDGGTQARSPRTRTGRARWRWTRRTSTGRTVMAQAR